MDFIAIGDTVVDEFINLKEARVSCDINNQNCTISMKWGDKIPYDSAMLVAGVGNAANAAVAVATFAKEGVNTEYVAVNDGIPTNHHYVLCYDAERTILVRHEAYPYRVPENITPPKWMYLSSVAEHTEAFHAELAEWLRKHPETKLAFQPGTFQIKMGKEKLAELYAAAELVAVNKEEAERILGVGLPAKAGESDIQELLRDMRALGPKIALLTDGPNGAYAFDGEQMLKVPMYPDPTPPKNRTGAGDAMTSTVVVALALGKPLAEALAWGPVNAMSVVQHVGAQKGLLTRDALEKFLAEAPTAYRVESF
ncbi:MAG: Sugar kinase, ribokinase family [Parcubacteria group bacterium GW2011_GWB1_57_6]|nr:MAG: Sugar kinase, ribokinase family [Parcubacteria group bacterium GW2011_GWB1_57_6]